MNEGDGLSAAKGNALSPPGPRPASVGILGVLSVVFGIGGLLCTPIVLFGLDFIARQEPDDPTWHRILTDRPYRIFLFATSTISIVLSVLLVVAGVGLLRLRAWGRRLAIGIGIASLVIPPVDILFDYILLTHQAIVAGRVKGGDAVGEEIVTELIYVVWEGIGMIFPAVLLYYLTRPKVRRAFTTPSK